MHSCSFALFYCLWFDLNLSLWGLKFKSNLLNLFVKRKNRKNLFGPNQQSGPFLFLTRKPRIPSPSLYKHPPAYFCVRRAQAAAGPSPLLFPPAPPAPCRSAAGAPDFLAVPVLHAVHLHLPCARRCCLPCTCQVPCCLHPPCRKHRCPTLHACFSSGPRMEQAAAVPSGFNSGHYDSSLLWVNSKTIFPLSHRLSHRISVLAPFPVFLGLS